METQFFFDQFISLCHVLMYYYHLHFTLSNSTEPKDFELDIYFDFNKDSLIDTISDFIAKNFPSFRTKVLVFNCVEHPFKCLKVEIK